jgi:hypothetical protein
MNVLRINFVEKMRFVGEMGLVLGGLIVTPLFSKPHVSPIGSRVQRMEGRIVSNHKWVSFFTRRPQFSLVDVRTGKAVAQLKMDKNLLDQASLFEGQIVAVKGSVTFSKREPFRVVTVDGIFPIPVR